MDLLTENSTYATNVTMTMTQAPNCGLEIATSSQSLVTRGPKQLEGLSTHVQILAFLVRTGGQTQRNVCSLCVGLRHESRNMWEDRFFKDLTHLWII